MSAFQDLINKSQEEKEPQRLLFLFAKARSMMGGPMHSYQSGTIDPIMCVDKLPEELTCFDDLVKEADEHTKEWDFILVSSFSGKNGVVPTSDEADPYLKQMTNMLLEGKDLTQFLIWNRKQETIIVS